MTAKKANAIKAAAKMVMVGDVDKAFSFGCISTGSGTSTNMNANEVIANLATQSLAKRLTPMMTLI